MKHPETGFLTGVVEGFYGRSWTFETRAAYAGYLSQIGLDSYLYCPKSDAYLRSRWRTDWPQKTAQALSTLCKTYRDAGLHFGVGLSPMALYEAYGPAERADLIAKVRRLQGLGLDQLAILFDDMPGDRADLASRQAEILADVAALVTDVSLLMCPTYYSFDLALERYFGAMPDNYWAELGASLDERVQVFWTGNSVCSAAITCADLKSIVATMKRPVTLWDNYPVNDGSARWKHLYTSPLPNRESGLDQYLAGHFCNPMNQGLASLPGLNGLAHLYGRAGMSEDQLVAALGKQTWQQLKGDGELFEKYGLDALKGAHRSALIQVYRGLPGAAASEIAGWLCEEYAFDPACLTD